MRVTPWRCVRRLGGWMLLGVLQQQLLLGMQEQQQQQKQ
jgi:hypothetical protein